PKNLHFSTLNPRMDLHSAFRIPTETVQWIPQHAGVSSFGMSGTNAHVVLSPPPAAADIDADASLEILVLSSRSQANLRQAAGQLAGQLSAEAPPLASVRHTLNRRTHLPHRLTVVAKTAEQAAKRLAAFSVGEVSSSVHTGAQTLPRVGFLFSGQGAQTVKMGKALAAHWPLFRESLESCAAVLDPLLPAPLLSVMMGEDEAALQDTTMAQPALLALQVALARCWRALGVVPEVVLGHSVGEIAAAHVAGILSLPDALALVSARGQAMGALPAGGAMAAVWAGEDVISTHLAAHPGLTLAAVNGPEQITVSGDEAAIDALCAVLTGEGIRARRLRTSHAFHSSRMEPALPAIARAASALSAEEAHTTFISSMDAATHTTLDVDYWAAQARQPVRFADALQAAGAVDLWIELGPHPGLLSLTPSGLRVPSLVRPTQQDAATAFAQAIAAVIAGGVAVDRTVWPQPVGEVIALESSPFLRQRYWVEAAPKPVAPDTANLAAVIAALSASGALTDAETLLAPKLLAAITSHGRLQQRAARAEPLMTTLHWQALPALSPRTAGRWLVVGDPGALRDAVLDALEHSNASGVAVDWSEHLAGSGSVDGVIALSPAADVPAAPTLAALSALRRAGSARLWWVTQGAVALASDEAVIPAQAASWGLGAALSREHPVQLGGLVDIADPTDAPALVAAILSGTAEDRLLIRQGTAHGQRLMPWSGGAGGVLTLSDGAILITGGLGALGMTIAGWLVDQGARHLVLVSRSGRRTERVAALESRGARVDVVAVDVSQRDALAAMLADLDVPLCGVIHAAGIGADGPALALTPADLDAVWQGKVQGALNLDHLTADQPLDFFVLMGSIAAVWGAAQLAAYASANALLAGLAQARHAAGRPALCVDWGPWAGEGMARDASLEQLAKMGIHALTADEALGALELAMTTDEARVTVASVEWSVLHRLLAAQRPTPLFSALVDTDTIAAPDWLAALQACEPTARHGHLQHSICTLLATIMELDGPEKVAPTVGFFDLGLSSLMALELKERLQQRLPITLAATAIFSHPTADALTEYLLERLDLRPTPSPTPSPTKTPDEDSEEQAVLALSDEEAAELLEAELAELED
ncbi:MAG: acyl transferase domain-containing protein, partial [Myxococcota bacterium]